MWQKMKDGFEERVGLQSLIRTKFKDYTVPGGINIFYSGHSHFDRIYDTGRYRIFSTYLLHPPSGLCI